MLCQFCKKNFANIIFVIVVNNQKRTVQVCNKCAEDKDFSNPLSGIPLLLGSILFGLEEGEPDEVIDQTLFQKQNTCSGCGLTYNEFRSSGLLGCERCYKTFEDDLKIILRRIHGNNKHFITKSDLSLKRKISELREELENAVIKEEFEKAAQLRDQIKNLEKDGK